MEKKVNSIYEEAYSDISKKWNKFMDGHYPKLDRAIQGLKEAEKSGDASAIKEAKDVYERTAKNIVVNNRRFNAMAEETAAKISHTNEVALAYVNDQLPGIYSLNYNAFGEEKIKGYSFSLVNESAVKELAKSDKTLLPKKKLDIPKDMQWNKKLINSQMLQGILQGENIPTMAKRLMNVTDMNRVSAIRNARTMTTAAENKGRQDSYKKATEDGVIMKRIWVATTDDRTRAWHADLDGVAVDVNEPWENDFGEIMYPGDPHADPANVYNCRCSIRAHVKGFEWNEELEEQAEKEVPDVRSIFNRLSDDIANNNILKSPDNTIQPYTGSYMFRVNKEVDSLIKNRIGYLDDVIAGASDYRKDIRLGVTTSADVVGTSSASLSFVTNSESKILHIETNALLFDISGSAKSVDSLRNVAMEQLEKQMIVNVDDNCLRLHAITHEYGHLIQNMILDGTEVPASFKGEPDEFMMLQSNALWKKVLDNSSYDDSQIISTLGLYGKSDPSEAFAEAFANAFCSKNPDPCGKAILEYLVKEGLIR